MMVFAEIIFHGFWTNHGGMLVEDNKLLNGCFKNNNEGFEWRGSI